MNGCEERKCRFWNTEKKICTDDMYVDPKDGQYCCRFREGAVLATCENCKNNINIDSNTCRIGGKDKPEFICDDYEYDEEA